MARQRRACCEAVAEGEPPKGGERGASGGGAQRRRAVRLGKVSGRAAGDGSGATEPRQRLCTGSAARTRKRSAQRALASVGARDRHRNGEDRVSGLRGAGRGEAAPGGIEPGARSPDRAGAQTFVLDELSISRRLSAMIGDAPICRKDGDWPDRAAMRWVGGGVGCGFGEEGKSGVSMAAREARRRYAVRRTASRRAEEERRLLKEGPASDRRRRDSAEPDARPRWWGEAAEAAPGARAAQARSAAPRSATLCTAQKERPIPRRSEGPALAGGRRAAVTRRRAGPGCRAGGPCRPGSR